LSHRSLNLFPQNSQKQEEKGGLRREEHGKRFEEKEGGEGEKGEKSADHGLTPKLPTSSYREPKRNNKRRGEKTSGANWGG